MNKFLQTIVLKRAIFRFLNRIDEYPMRTEEIITCRLQSVVW